MVINYKNTAMLSNSRYLTHTITHTHMTGEERRNSMERDISSNRSSCSGAGEPSSSVASSSVAVAGEEANAHVHVRESAAAPEQSGPVPTDQSAEDDEDVKRWNMESVVDQLLFLINNSTHRRRVNDGGNTQNNLASNNNNSTDEKKEKEKRSKKKKRSRGSSSSSSAHTCEVCGKTFAKGQSLGGHKRKHYDIQKKLITDKRRAREKQKETPAPAAVERRGGHTVAAMVKIEEERMASSCNATFDLHNPALLLLQSVQLEGPSAANGARRPHEFDLNEPAAPQEEREKAPQPQPQPETERKDNNDDADDLLSFRLWPKFDSQISN